MQDSGIGGSESAVISLSNELAKLDWTVEVYANPARSDYGRSAQGPYWLPHWAYDPADVPDVFVAWRFAEALAVGAHARTRFLWLHDEVRSHACLRLPH